MFRILQFKIVMARPRTFNKTDVLKQTRDLFWRKGYADTSVSDLEQATGLKRTSLYAAFGCKQQLYLQSLAGYQTEARQRIAKIFAQTDDPLERLELLLTQSIENALTDRDRKGCFLSNAAAERGGICPETTDFIRDNREGVVHIFQQQLDLAAERGQISGPTKPLADYLFIFYSGLMNTLRTGTDRATVFDALTAGLRTLRRG